MTYVVSLGGSIVSPIEGPDAAFLAELRRRLESWLEREPSRRIILVVGGGGPARSYQAAFRDFSRIRGEGADDESLDWIGIAATKLNAELVRAVMGPLCKDPVVTDPSEAVEFSGRALVASGWKPGFSSDFDAVYLGEKFGATIVLNLSNIAKVYTADPKLHPEAKPIDAIGWADFRAMVGDIWTPGANLPFDPIASSRAEKAGIKVICAAGRDLDNLFLILEDKPFTGTVIG